MKRILVEIEKVQNRLKRDLMKSLENMYLERATNDNDSKFSIVIGEDGASISIKFNPEEMMKKKIGAPVSVSIDFTELNSEQDILFHVYIAKLVVENNIIQVAKETLFRGHAGDESDFETILNIIGVIDMIDEFAEGNDGYSVYKELLCPDGVEDKTIEGVLTDLRESNIKALTELLAIDLLAIVYPLSEDGTVDTETIMNSEDFRVINDIIAKRVTNNLHDASLDLIDSLITAVDNFEFELRTAKIEHELSYSDIDDDDEFYDEHEHECNCRHHHHEDMDEENNVIEDLEDLMEDDEDIEALGVLVNEIIDENDNVYMDDIVSILGKVISHNTLDVDVPAELDNLMDWLKDAQNKGENPFDIAFNYIEAYNSEREDEDDDEEDIVYDEE